VVRSNVATVSGTGMKYHTAVALKEALALCEDVFAAPADQRSAERRLDNEAPFDSLTLVATVPQTSQELQEQLGANDW
jgi:hypothetical protein